jgi:hypothetical membrane protein
MQAKQAAPLLLISGIAALIVHAIAVVISGSIYPGYSHASQFISELGATGAPAPSILNFGGLVPAGALTIAFALALNWCYRQGKALALSSAFVAMAGLSRMVAGIFPCDPGCSLENMSISGKIHSAAGFTAFISGMLAPLIFASVIRRKRHSLFWSSLLLACGMIVFFAIGAQQGPGTPYIGVWQRMNLICFYAWIVIVAVGGAVGQRSER